MRPAHTPSVDDAVARQVLTTMSRTRKTFPLTAGFMQTAAKQWFGLEMGRARAGRAVARLAAAKRVSQVGRYKGKRHGFWVALYTSSGPEAPVTSSVLRNSVVKPRSWWQHPLFGNPDGSPPLGASEEQLARWRKTCWR